MHLSEETKSAFVSLIVTFAQVSFVAFGICYGIAVYREVDPIGYLKSTEMEIQEEEPLVNGLFEQMDSTEGQEFLRKILLQRSPNTVLYVLNHHQLCLLGPEIVQRISELKGAPPRLDGSPVLRERLEKYQQRCSTIVLVKGR